jgi:hypothetical protein
MRLPLLGLLATSVAGPQASGVPSDSGAGRPFACNGRCSVGARRSDKTAVDQIDARNLS